MDRLTRDPARQSAFARHGYVSVDNPDRLLQHEVVQIFLEGQLPGGVDMLSAYCDCLGWLLDHLAVRGPALDANAVYTLCVSYLSAALRSGSFIQLGYPKARWPQHMCGLCMAILRWLQEHG